jgi:8-amino-7-oxononanoate synthase
MFINQLPGRILISQQQSWLYFSGTAYLGIHQHPEFLSLLTDGLHQFGTHYGGSRLAPFTLDIYDAAEDYLAQWTGAEAALLTSSGTIAGQLAVHYLSQHHNCYFAPGVHPALWGQSPPASGDFATWTHQMLERAHQERQPMALFSNALDPLHAVSFDFSPFREWPSDTPMVLVLDDSHGIGITGPDGAGIRARLPSLPAAVELVVIQSLGKAPGIPAGALTGTRQTLRAIRQSALFGGASPPNPAFLYAFIHAAHLYRDSRQRLQQRIQQLVAGWPENTHVRYIRDYPVFYTPNQAFAERLKNKLILVSSFPYPTPADETITRVVLNALHTAADITLLLEAMLTPP